MGTAPTPPTFTDGVAITAANLNAALQAPCDWLANTKPHAFARQLDATNGPTAITSALWTTVLWDFVDVDTDTTKGFTFSGSPSRTTYYNVNTAGYYLITGHLNYNNTSTANSRMARLAYSVGAGTILIIPGAVEAVPATAVATGLCVTAIRNCAVNDRIYLQGYQDSGITVNTNLNYAGFRNETSYLDVMWVGK